MPASVTSEDTFPESAPSAAADRDKACQVLVNFVENVIKYDLTEGASKSGSTILSARSASTTPTRGRESPSSSKSGSSTSSTASILR